MVEIGVNWTTPRDSEVVEELVKSGRIDFVEIMIDNFLVATEDSIMDVLGGLPCSFHIMNSRFMHRPDEELQEMLEVIREFAATLRPFYISDHLGCFYFDGQALPRMAEINYDSMLELAIKRVELFQTIMGQQVLFENFPSVMRESGLKQPQFLRSLCQETGCGILFDISNADIASQNTGLELCAWIPVIKESEHFHIGGFAPTTFQPNFLVDTHDSNLSDTSLEFVDHLVNPFANTLSIVVERDDNLELDPWLGDIEKIRRSVAAKYDNPRNDLASVASA